MRACTGASVTARNSLDGRQRQAFAQRFLRLVHNVHLEAAHFRSIFLKNYLMGVRTLFSRDRYGTSFADLLMLIFFVDPIISAVDFVKAVIAFVVRLCRKDDRNR